jgi:hypothetical protein
MPDALSDQISLFFWQKGKNSGAVDNLETEKGMIHSQAVIEGAKVPQLLEPAHIVKEGQRLRKGHILFLNAQRSGDYCDVLADSVGMRKLENYVLFDLCIRAMKAAGIIFKPFVAEKELFFIHVRL